MKNVTTLSIIGGAALAGSAFAGTVAVQPAAPAPAEVNSSLAVGYDSQYIHRGVNYGNDAVTAKLATAFTCPLTGLTIDASALYTSANGGGLGVNAFGASFVRDEILNNELRLNLGTSKELCYGLTAHVGYTMYHYFDSNDAFHGEIDDDHEVYFGLSRQLFGFDTSVVYNWGLDGDLRGNNEGYSEFNVGRGFDVAGYTLNTNLEVGYLVEEGALSHATASVSYDHKISENATLTPYIAHTWELDDLERSLGTVNGYGFSLNEQNEFFAGAVLKVTF